MIDVTFKNEVIETLQIQLKIKMKTLESQILQIGVEKSAETKSVMGDKHETSRGMLQREEDHLKQQYAILKQKNAHFALLKSKVASNVVLSGSLVLLDIGLFYISISFGKIKVDEKSIYCMSPDAPLSKTLVGLKAGDLCTFNGKNVEILEIA